MTQEKDKKIHANLRIIFSTSVNFYLLELVKSEFDRHINARPYLQATDRLRIRNAYKTCCFKTHFVRKKLNIYRGRLGHFAPS